MIKFFKNLFDRRPRVSAIIEMPAGTTDKIEIKCGVALIDRKLDIPVPVNYGFIPSTHAEDGDPVDIFVVSDKFLRTTDIVTVRVIGKFTCIDKGVRDDKLLGIVEGENHSELPVMKKVAHYLLNYKPGFKIEGWTCVTNKDIDTYRT